MFCPTCNSNNIQKLSLVFENGLSHIDTRTSGSGVGVGVGGGGVGVGLGFGGGRTRGTQMTATAAKAAPPQKRRYGWFVFFAVICFFIGESAHTWLLGTLLFGWLAFSAAKYNRTQFPILFRTWDEAYMCTRCGTIAPPSRSGPAVVARPYGVLTVDQPKLEPRQLGTSEDS